jgi:L-lactate dehydrogenase complex protein LldG
VSREQRAAVLGAIRGALADVPREEGPGDVVVPRDYLEARPAQRAEVLERFVERTGHYRATVNRTSDGAVRRLLAEVLETEGARRIVIPPDLPARWRPKGFELVEDDQLATLELDAMDGVITGCAVAIAETGTIVLDSGFAQGRRALTLLPDLHVCIVEAERVEASVPEGLRRAFVGAGRRPLTLVSGPSATSDIELTRVEGVHGPRRLHVVVLEG